MGIKRLGRVALTVAVLVGILVADGAVSVAQDPGATQGPGCVAGEVTASRTRDSKTFRNADCSYSSTFGSLLHYKDESGRWQDVDLRFRSGDGEYVMDRHELIARVRGASVEITDRASGTGIRWLTPVAPAVAGRSAHYSSSGLDWTYSTRKSGLKLAAVVSEARGLQTYEFRYQLLGGAADFSLNEEGNLVSNGFVVPRATVLGANLEHYEAGKWQLLAGQRVTFTFDDSALPAEAFPYELDPTTTFKVNVGSDDGTVQGHSSTYPPPGGTSTDLTGPYVTAGRTYQWWLSPPAYSTWAAVMRWNTSALPDGAVLTSANLLVNKWYSPIYDSTTYDQDKRNLTADWHEVGSITTNSFSKDAQTSALTRVPLWLFSNNVDYSISLDNTNGVSTTGYTGLRLHVDGGEPTGMNHVYFTAFDDTSYAEPRLVVNYDLPSSPSLFSVSDSPDPVSAGDATTFTLSWSDPNAGDSVRGLICKTASVTPTGLCADGALAAGNYSTSSPSTVSYRSWPEDVGTNTYYAFACDASGGCSAPLSGTFTVTNSPPSATSATDSPDPVLAGNVVNFAVTWTDPNSNDSVRAVICKTNAVSGGSCSGGAWATGTSSSTSPSSATYATSSSNIGTNSYYAFACDRSNACSGALSGSFSVSAPNTAPSITSASDAPDPVTAGNVLNFTVGWSDSNSDDAVRALICKTNAVASGSCSGGTWATGSASSSSPSAASFTTSLAIVGTNSYYAFACDQSNACSSSASGTFTVVQPNAAPSINSVSDSPDPVNEGSVVTFNVGWSDPGDSVRAVVCRTNAIAGGVCQGGALASGGLSQSSPSSATYSTRASDAGTMTYYAFACDSSNACSSGVAGSVTVNALPPPDAPVITNTPDDPTRAPTLTFAFTGNTGDSFECSLTGPSGTVAPYAPCGSPKGYNSSGMTPGFYVFEVRAVSAAGRPSEASDAEIAVHVGGDGVEIEESPYEADADAADAQAQQFSGTRHGGSWQTYSQDRTINLHVAVARMTPLDEVLIEALTREGVIVIAHRVEYSTIDLERFADTVTPVDKSRGYATFIDVDHNRVVLEVEDPSGTESGQPAADLGSSIPADAIETRWVRSVVAVPAAAATRSTFPPYKAGNRWGLEGTNPICGVAFTMVLPDSGQKSGLTAGHCGSEGTGVYMGAKRRARVGRMFSDGEHGQDVVVSDSALITLHDHQATRNLFIKPNFSRMVIRTDRELRLGEDVCLSGARTGIDCGKITKWRERVRSSEGWSWKRLWCSNAKGAIGDSGSPVYRPTGPETGRAVAIGVMVTFDEYDPKRELNKICFEGIAEVETHRERKVWDG